MESLIRSLANWRLENDKKMWNYPQALWSSLFKLHEVESKRAKFWAVKGLTCDQASLFFFLTPFYIFGGCRTIWATGGIWFAETPRMRNLQINAAFFQNETHLSLLSGKKKCLPKTELSENTFQIERCWSLTVIVLKCRQKTFGNKSVSKIWRHVH